MRSLSWRKGGVKNVAIFFFEISRNLGDNQYVHISPRWCNLQHKAGTLTCNLVQLEFQSLSCVFC